MSRIQGLGFEGCRDEGMVAESKESKCRSIRVNKNMQSRFRTTYLGPTPSAFVYGNGLDNCQSHCAVYLR